MIKVECDSDDCRIHVSEGMSTLAYYPPVYDKTGNNINPDMNTSYGKAGCSVCKRSWDWKREQGILTSEEIL